MADPVTLLILVTAGEQPDLTRAMTRATREALGADAVVAVREVPGEPTDSEALATERSEGANAVVELSWSDAHHQQAFVRMHFAPEQRWIERSIGFLRFDADVERGRTIGFTIASIFPQPPVAPGPPSSGTGQSPVEGAGQGPSPGAPSAGQTTTDGALLTPSVAPTLPTTGPVPESAPGSMRRLNLALEVLAVGAGAVGGSDDVGGAAGIGGAAGVQWFPIRNISLRVAGDLRAGNVTAVLPTLTVMGCAGVAFHPWRTSTVRPFGASIRAEGLVASEFVSYFAAITQKSQTQSADVGGFDFVADASWRFIPDAELVLGAGVQALFPPAHILIQGDLAATLSPVSLVGEGGLRLDF